MRDKVVAVTLAVAIVGSSAALGEDMHDETQAHDGDEMEHETAEAEDPVIREWLAINERMHENMMIEFTGDPDTDFARSMIPHHQGAIEMAETVLEHGEDPRIRAKAEEMLETQEAEIEALESWLEKHGAQKGGAQ